MSFDVLWTHVIITQNKVHIEHCHYPRKSDGECSLSYFMPQLLSHGRSFFAQLFCPSLQRADALALKEVPECLRGVFFHFPALLPILGKWAFLYLVGALCLRGNFSQLSYQTSRLLYATYALGRTVRKFGGWVQAQSNAWGSLEFLSVTPVHMQPLKTHWRFGLFLHTSIWGGFIFHVLLWHAWGCWPPAGAGLHSNRLSSRQPWSSSLPWRSCNFLEFMEVSLYPHISGGFLKTMIFIPYPTWLERLEVTFSFLFFFI